MTGLSEDHYKEINSGYATFDTILVGRVTAAEMVEFRPTVRDDESAGESHKNMAEKMHPDKKFAFTTDSELTIDWHNAEPVVVSSDADIRSFVDDLKSQSGGDIHLSGGAKLAQTLVRLGLVDEYRFFVYPVYSPGESWFGELETQETLELISSTSFEDGAIALYCKPGG